MDKPIAIVLGGTAPHSLLVNKLKDRGYYVILVDYLNNPPAKEFADEHIQASTLDKENVLKISRERHAQLVISTCIDQANSVCCYVAEKLGLPHPYSYQTSVEVTDKGLMKKKMCENGIPTSPFTLTTSIDDIKWDRIKFPAVVKPVDCNSSKGVKRVDNKQEVVTAVSNAINLSRTAIAIIEGFNRGVEIQVDCASTSQGVKVMMTRQKQKIASNDNEMVLQSFGSIFPAPLDDRLRIEIQRIAEGIASVFHLINTPFFYQAIVTNKGIQVLEFAPRVGGGLSYHVLKEFANYDAVEVAIDSFLGKEIQVEPQRQKYFLSTNIIYMNSGIYGHTSGLEEARKKGLIDNFFLMKCYGEKVDGDMRSTNRVAAFIVYGESYEELRRKTREVLLQTEIYSITGEPLMNKEIYLELYETPSI